METIKVFIDIFMVVFIHLILPVAGIVVYIRLLRKMRKEQIPNIPKGALFLLFFVYGGILMEILTGLFWVQSGMSSLGLVFLIFIAPVICGIIAWQQRNNIGVSKYHRVIQRMALGYLLGETVLIGVVIMVFIGNMIYTAFTSQ